MSYLIAFDIETTGFSPYEHGLLEVAGVKFRPGEIEFETFHELADPAVPIPQRVQQITGITAEMVAGCRPPIDVLRAFLEWAGPNAHFLAHNAPFDIRFINATFLNHAEPVPTLRLVDTLPWTRACFPDLESHALSRVLEHIGAQTEGLHRALADAMGVRALVLNLLQGEADPADAVARHVMASALPRRQSLYPDSMID